MPAALVNSRLTSYPNSYVSKLGDQMGVSVVDMIQPLSISYIVILLVLVVRTKHIGNKLSSSRLFFIELQHKFAKLGFCNSWNGVLQREERLVVAFWQFLR